MNGRTVTDRQIKKSLKQAGKSKECMDGIQKNKRIEAIVSTFVKLPERGSFYEFVIQQMGFVNKTVLLLQGLWAAFFFYFIWKGKDLFLTNESLWVLSMAPPLLLLLTIEDVAHVYNRSMLEIEYATKYSLKKLVMVRMLFFGMVNGILLGIGIIFSNRQMGIKMEETFVYCLTPLLLMTFILLLCMKKWKGDSLKYIAVSIYIAFALILIVGKTEYFNLYSPSLFVVWALFCAGGMIAVVLQFVYLMKHLNYFEALMGG